MENLTHAERMELLTRLNSGSMACTRFANWLNHQPYNELTNKWYKDITETRSEIWTAWEWAYNGSPR